MTGVPAAQIVAEEAAMVKEENRKREAIQKYEEFLKKFYKQNNIVINQIKKTKATVAVNPLSSVNKQEKTRNSMQGKNFSEDIGQTKDNYTKRGDAIDVQRDAPKKKLNDDLDISEAESEKENDDQE